VPTEEDMKRMLLQVEILVSIVETNEKVAGDKGFLLISHSNIKVMIVPLTSGSNGKTLVVTFTQFRDIENFVKSVLERAKTLA
jgi:phenylacetate-coenzyme A ligase PaaK-like adenylate-forming protein